MNEMVERVAKAIAEVLTRDRPHPVSGRGYCLLIVEDEDAKEMARAAIEAMREPTEAMLLIRCDPLVRLGEPETPRVMQWRNGFWRGMIDEALK